MVLGVCARGHMRGYRGLEGHGAVLVFAHDDILCTTPRVLAVCIDRWCM